MLYLFTCIYIFGSRGRVCNQQKRDTHGIIAPIHAAMTISNFAHGRIGSLDQCYFADTNVIMTGYWQLPMSIPSRLLYPQVSYQATSREVGGKSTVLLLTSELTT